MDKEAIKEIAEQLGKGVNWVEDELVPYMYNYAEYRLVWCTVMTIILGLLFVTGLCFVGKGIHLYTKREDHWDDDGFGWILGGVITAFFGFMFGIIALDSALSWGIAPEVTFITKIAG